ncbi:MAG: cytidylyltransferase [Elusimicrobia bacterium]|nr:cytidylyltransferase [Elusimicrobiota bacterium]
MICALMLGRDGSKGYPGKNTALVLGRPLMAYPLLAARASRRVERTYVSTDSPSIKETARRYGALVIDRPAELCTAQALGEDAFAHGCRHIAGALKGEGLSLELLVLLFCNAATVTGELIDAGIEALRADPKLDSAVSVSRYNMWSPLRARRETKDGILEPFVPFETFGDPKTLNCDRDSQGDVWFADMGVSVVRPKCLEELHSGLLPQKWMGRRIFPLKQWGGCDVDYEWQVPGVEFWLKKHGYVGEEPQEVLGEAAAGR